MNGTEKTFKETKNMNTDPKNDEEVIEDAFPSTEDMEALEEEYKYFAEHPEEDENSDEYDGAYMEACESYQAYNEFFEG